MASWQAKIFGALVRMFVRRERWGRDDRELARRARRVFGAPRVLQWYETLDLTIEPVNTPDLRGEWLRAKQSDSENKIVFYIHGGGFVSCSAATHRPVTAALARLTKLPVFAVDYRLAPEHRFPAALDDVFEAYKRLLKKGFDSRKIAVAGDSAGGGLVLSLILRLREAELPLPACGVCFSAWTDMMGGGKSRRENATRDAMFYPENISEFADAYLRDAVPRPNVYASPALADFKDFPPVLFQVGAGEILLDDSRRIHEKILQTGGTSELEIYEGVFHGWQMLSRFMPESSEALQKAAAFISRHTI